MLSDSNGRRVSLANGLRYQSINQQRRCENFQHVLLIPFTTCPSLRAKLLRQFTLPLSRRCFPLQRLRIRREQAPQTPRAPGRENVGKLPAAHLHGHLADHQIALSLVLSETEWLSLIMEGPAGTVAAEITLWRLATRANYAC